MAVRASFAAPSRLWVLGWLVFWLAVPAVAQVERNDDVQVVRVDDTPPVDSSEEQSAEEIAPDAQDAETVDDEDEPADEETPEELESQQHAITGGGGGQDSGAQGPVISLPNAEGSMEGMGESFAPVLSSGTATFSVPIAVPDGRAGVQPSLTLAYSSSNGNGPLGIGWQMSVPFIQRQTDRGLPQYDDQASWHGHEDRFLYNGGQELVPVNNADIAAIDGSGGAYNNTNNIPADLIGWQQYRARVEGSFMRFFRAPDFSRFVVQSKDGTRFDFGLLPAGTGPSDLRSIDALQKAPGSGDERIFRWYLTRMSDAHGSTVYYRYFEDWGSVYVQEVFYLSPASCAGQPGSSTVQTRRDCTAPLSEYGARVLFEYEDRDDDTSSYVSTWRIDQYKRMKGIIVSAAEDTLGVRYMVRRYHLTYNPDVYYSLLQSVQLEGSPDALDATSGTRVRTLVSESAVGSTSGPMLPPMTFAYTGGDNTAAPYGGAVNESYDIYGSPDVSLSNPDADFFDVNGDGLPDVVHTNPAEYGGNAGVFFNGFFSADASPSETAATFSNAIEVPVPSSQGGVMRFSNTSIAPIDADGDGRGDLLHLNHPILNYGWFTPTRDRDAGIAEVSPYEQGWEFTYANVNLTSTNHPLADYTVNSANYKFVDVNNDHLIDIVRTSGTLMSTWLNLGWVPGGEGQFGQAFYDDFNDTYTISTDPITSCLLQAGLPLSFSDPKVRIADMNGDGISDIVRLQDNNVEYWPGRGPGLWGDDSTTSCPQGYGNNLQRDMDNSPWSIGLFLSRTHLVDLNADGAADLVQIYSHDVEIWYNEGGNRFSASVVLDAAVIFSEYDVRFVDVDGSGTTDVVYGVGNNYRYIDVLGGQKPRLLKEVNNGLGARTTIDYRSSTIDYLRDLQDAQSCMSSDCERFTWSHAGPEEGVSNPGADAHCDQVLFDKANTCTYKSGGTPLVTTVVAAVQTTDQFNAVGREENISRTEYAYHDGYYEGIEQEFRGFAVADSVSIGDADHPSQLTRTHFHQGRRPSSIASDRTADNPYEALKGRTYLTEVSDENGVYLSTTHAQMTVRTLATGLNGVGVHYAYVSQTDAFSYDTAPFTASAQTVSLPWRITEQANASGVVSVSETLSHDVKIRGQRAAWIRSTTDDVDNLGQVLLSTAHGRIKDAHDAGPTNYGEEIVQVSTPQLLAGGQWIWRTRSAYVRGNDPTERLNNTRFFYDSEGNQTKATQQITIPLAFDFSGDNQGAASYTQRNTTQTSSTRFDAWGNPIAQCVGADLGASQDARCLRYKELSYDGVYSQLPEKESVAAHTRTGASYCDSASSAPFCMLSTTANWQRGLGTLTSVTDPNGHTNTVGYDGLSRLTHLTPPSLGCQVNNTPSFRAHYDLAVSGGPISRIRAEQVYFEPGACADEKTIQTRTYIDGLGRPRSALTLSEHNNWERSAVAYFTNRGAALQACNNDTVAGTAEPSVVAAIAPTSAPCAQTQYDAFDRPVQITERDASISTQSYHALATQACDANDLDPASPHVDTCTLTRTDGHGRTIDQVLHQRRQNMNDEYYRLITEYRADKGITRVTRAQTTDDQPWPNATVVSNAHGVPRSLQRTFALDSAGRRIATSDPDSDSPTNSNPRTRFWRYLFNNADDLVAVRDPRGCGKNMYYDHSGRLIGEDYVMCAEAQHHGARPVISLPTDALALSRVGQRKLVDAFYQYDDMIPGLPAALVIPGGNFVGQLAATVDRGQRSLMSYDSRGRAIWAARQMAIIPQAVSAPLTLSGNDSAVFENDTPTTIRAQQYDAAHSYITQTQYDHLDRVIALQLPKDPDWTAMGGTGPAPIVGGSMTYQQRGLPQSTSLSITTQGPGNDITIPVIRSSTYDDNRLLTTLQHGQASTTGVPTQTFTYDSRLRPIRHRVTRTATQATSASKPLGAVTTVCNTRNTWDSVDNLTGIEDNRPANQWPAGYKPASQTIGHDALYRVASIDAFYPPNGQGTDTDVFTDWRAMNAPASTMMAIPTGKLTRCGASRRLWCQKHPPTAS